MLDPRLLRLFVSLAEDLHFRRTADRLDLAQSTVSSQLQRLEDIIGAPLFTRGKKAAVGLTDVGQIFLAEARNALDRLTLAENIGRTAARGAAGPLSIGYIFSAVPSGVLPTLLRGINRALPLVAVMPRLVETPEQIAAIADRRLDIGLGRPRPAYPAGVHARIVHSENLVLLLPEDHPLAGLATIPADAVAGLTFLVPQFNEPFGLLEKLEGLAAAGGFPMPPLMRTSDFITAASMAAAGYGLVLAPASLARIGLDRLVVRPIDWFSDRVDMAIFWHESGSRAARQVIGLPVLP